MLGNLRFGQLQALPDWIRVLFSASVAEGFTHLTEVTVNIFSLPPMRGERKRGFSSGSEFSSLMDLDVCAS